MRFVTFISLFFFTSFAAQADPAMWRVRDADTEITFFGTFHLLHPDMNWQTDEMLEDVRTADRLYLEVDLANVDQLAMVQIMREKGLFPIPPGIRKVLSRSEYRAFEDAVTAAGLSVQQLSMMKPWLASSTLVVEGFAKLGFSADAGADARLALLAQGYGVKTDGLETLSDQLSMLGDLPMDVQVMMLNDTVEQLEEAMEDFPVMSDSWLQGDEETMQTYFVDEMKQLPDLYDALIIQRNQRWAEEIGDLLDEDGGDYFIAVGVAHLIGDDSVLAILESAGYTVERIQ